MHEHHGHAPAAAGSQPRGADRHAGHQVGAFKRKFWVCLVLTLPVLIWTEHIQEWFNFTAPEFPGSAQIPLIFSAIIYFYGGWVFIQGAWRELQARRPGMMTLIALAISVAFFYSIATELGLAGEPLYWELSTLVVIMLLGHWIEMSAVGRAQNALAELAKLLPDTAEVVQPDGSTVTTPLNELQTGDVLLVRPGANVPADGEVIDGRSSVNEAIITGESRPVDKAPGDSVIGGAINGQGALRVRVTTLGEDSALGQIMRIVADAQASRTHAQDLADRAAFLLTIAALIAGTVTLIAWLAAGEDTSYAIERMVTVLVISCPHALGLAIPLVIAISTALSARNGMLVRNRLALENSRNLTRVVFDKTGTLTKGELGVVELQPLGELEPARAVALAAAVERDSEHPIAVAIRNRAKRDGVPVPDVHDFTSIAGQGVQAQVDGHAVAVGGPRLLEAVQFTLPAGGQQYAERWGGEGKSVIYLLVDGKPAAMFGLADVVREESRQAVADLKELGVGVTMLTGDSRDVAAWVARELGIDDVRAQVLPADKADVVAQFKGPDQTVAMVGDGVNDAPALVTADVGIAIGAGTDVAIDSADIVLVKSDPRDVAKVVRLSRSVYRKMLQNLAWAAGYNIVAVPLAAGVLAPIGIVLAPAAGAVLMSLSTIIVALNAQLLRRVKLGDA